MILATNDNKGLVLPAIYLISSPGFAEGWAPLNISRIKAFLMSHGYKVINLPLCVEFSHYIQRYYSYLKSIDCNIGEFGYTWHELYLSALLFKHQSPNELIRQTVYDMCRGKDIYRTVLTFDSTKDPSPNINQVRAESRRIQRYCGLMQKWIKNRIGQIDWRKVDVVGFSCLEAQFLTSIYIAREIRKRGGIQTRFIFGGAMFRPDNIDALLNNFPDIQHIILGDGEFPLLKMLELLNQGKQIPQVIANLSAPVSPLTVNNRFGLLNKYPPPNYDEIKVDKISNLSLTTYMGKGCSHWRCSFCPNNEKGQYIRSAENIFKEIKYIVKTYNTVDINFGDLEINGDSIKLETLCDLLIKNNIKLEAWGEINARNTSIKLYRKMKEAGIDRVQIGIESFSDRVLRCMGKPATVMDNIKALKYGVETKMKSILFNLICDHPMISNIDLEDIYKIIRLISHLIQPPVKLVFNEIELYRTSDLFDKADKFKIYRIKDYKYYQRCYPEKALKTKIPMFNLSFQKKPLNPSWHNIYRFINKLRSKPTKLRIRKLKNSSRIYDSRQFKLKTYILNGLNELVLEQTLDSVTTPAVIAKALDIPEDQIIKSLNWLVKNKLVFDRNNRYLGLPLKK